MESFDKALAFSAAVGATQSINGSKLCFEKLLSKIDLQICKFITHYDAFIIISFMPFLRWEVNCHLQRQDH